MWSFGLSSTPLRRATTLLDREDPLTESIGRPPQSAALISNPQLPRG